MGTDVPGFADISENVDNTGYGEKRKDKAKKGGGFQSMGLSFQILKGITKKGYKVPTPIQRKVYDICLI